ncbi:MAG: transporter [Bacteroidetes bacterium]|nr:MAG: transporter [Bacteroidota bacterium]TAG94110.1 MAG: transporter [Bacteroidota bacterium]
MLSFYKFLIIYTFFCLSCADIYAQHTHIVGDSVEFIVDRPGIADLPYTVKPHQYQLEVGFERIDRKDYFRWLAPTFLLRTGISDKAEIRFGTKYIVQDSLTDLSEPFNWDSGFAPLSIGFKTKMVSENGIIPEIALLTDILLPFTKSEYRAKYSGHDIFLLMNHTLNKKWNLNTNVGAIWENVSNEAIWMYAFCLDYQPTRRLGFFLEQYTYLPDESPTEIGFDVGITYLVAPKMQFDVSAGISKVNNNLMNFVGCGFTIRIDRKKNPNIRN